MKQRFAFGAEIPISGKEVQPWEYTGCVDMKTEGRRL